MSNFTFNCPHCGNPLKAQEEWRGQQTDCPYCGQTITVPTAITLQKPNIVKRAILQSKNYIRNNKKRIVAVSLGMLGGLVATFLIVHKMNKEFEEARVCRIRMKSLASDLTAKKSGSLLDAFNSIYDGLQYCPSGKKYIVHSDGDIKINEVSDQAIVVECPKHRDHVITRSKFWGVFVGRFRAEDFDRSISVRQNQK